MIYYNPKFLLSKYYDFPPKKVELYRFKTRFNRVYLVNIELYPNDILFVKFYLKQHSDSLNKYKIVVGDYDAIRILNTILQIANILLNLNPILSFGFVGESSINEPISKTKRYRVYSKIAKKNFSPDHFLHYFNDEKSTYFLTNNRNSTLDIGFIENQFSQYYDISN